VSNAGRGAIATRASWIGRALAPIAALIERFARHSDQARDLL